MLLVAWYEFSNLVIFKMSKLIILLYTNRTQACLVHPPLLYALKVPSLFFLPQTLILLQTLNLLNKKD